MSYTLLNPLPGYVPGIIPKNSNSVNSANNMNGISSFTKQNSALNPVTVDEYNRMLNQDRYNGRVNILEPEDPTVVFRMTEKIATKNKATEYRDALEGNWENNVIAQVYFSAGNIQIIQNALRAGVYSMSQNKIIVPPQNMDALKVIMRSIYLQYAQHYPTKITEQIEQLNHYVLDYSVPFVYNEAVAYKKYMEDQSTLVIPLQHPIHHDRQYKQLELKPWF